ncbi:hypothetical protein ACIOD2_32135 [Amycolatopsis sp. NPDC088138]|uniref:hypothetical protein n=1 Tax=Amycolatopsis sp. NPDC088138 TaxID=3363938 RepID=UPI003822E9CF
MTAQEDPRGAEHIVRRAEHIARLAEYGSNYALGYLNALVQSYLDGETDKAFLRKAHAELMADMKAAEQ